MPDKLREFFESSSYQAILDYVIDKEKSGKLKNLSVDDQIKIYYYKSRSLERLGEFQEALIIATEKTKELSLPRKKSLLLLLLISQIYSFYRLGDLDLGLSKYDHGLSIIASLTEKEKKEAIEWIALFKNVIGIIYHSKGDLDSSLELFETALSLREEAKIPKEISISLNNIGAVHAHKGNYLKALEYYERSLDIAKSINHLEGMAYSLNNLGTMYEKKANIDKALDYYKQSLVVKESIGNKYDIAGTKHNIGVIYFSKRDLTTSMKFFEESLELKLAIGNDVYTSSTVFDLILVNSDLKFSLEFKKYLEILEKLNKRTDDRTINLYYRISKAINLKKSKRIIDKAEAQKILSELINEEVIIFEITALSMVYLCELLLFELKSVGDFEVLEETKNLLKKLFEFAQSQDSSLLSVEVLILRARFAIIGGELEIALENLEKAREIAKEKKLLLLLQNVEEEKKALESEYEKWQKLIEQNSPIQERLEKFRLEEYTREIKKLVSTMKN